MTTISPLRSGTPEQFAAARDLLRSSGYSSEAICERYEIPEIYQFRSIGEGRISHQRIEDRLDLLVRLFMDGAPIAADVFAEHLGTESIELLTTLGLVDRHPQAPDRYAASVLLYPIGPVYIVSDTEDHAPGLAFSDELERPDHVFSAITTLTGTFLRFLPETPSRNLLDLCAGTGVAGLRFAGHAGQVVAADIAGRSVEFASFNARLNGITNFTAVQGDLFEPLQRRTFDRIVAHPPYVPASEVRLIYRDGGEDGESILRRILAGLPDHLEQGGSFYCTCVATDRENAPLEDRLREMIGERGNEFDLALVTHHSMPLAEYYGRLATSGRITYRTAEERIALFRRLEAERVVYASFVCRRHGEARSAFTVRREISSGRDWRDLEWLVTWNTRLAEGDVVPVLIESRPILSSRTRFHVTHEIVSNEWKVESSRVTVDAPFQQTVDMSPNAAMLLTLFDGRTAVREILERLKSAGAVPAGLPEEAFAEFVRELVGAGVLLLDRPAGQPL